jgi:hypothetical protein
VEGAEQAVEEDRRFERAGGAEELTGGDGAGVAAGAGQPLVADGPPVGEAEDGLEGALDAEVLELGLDRRVDGVEEVRVGAKAGSAVLAAAVMARRRGPDVAYFIP